MFVTKFNIVALLLISSNSYIINNNVMHTTTTTIKYKYYVRNLKINPIWNRKKILKICRENKFIIESGSVKFFEWSKLSKFLKKKLSSNSNYLIT